MAINLLLDKNNIYTINEIAEIVGYSSQHYFSRSFKNYTGLSPLQYKTKINDDNTIGTGPFDHLK